jgi:hypothetical protein
VYYDPTQLVSLTGLIHAPVLEKYWKTNFRDMTQFYADAAAGDHARVFESVEDRGGCRGVEPLRVRAVGVVDDEPVRGGGVEVIHAPVLEKYWKTNFRDMTQFYADAAAGDLPAYATSCVGS